MFFARRFYGYWYGDDVADVGNIRFFAYRDNLVLELSLAGEDNLSNFNKGLLLVRTTTYCIWYVCTVHLGSWLSFVVWLAILILMLKERHYLKANLYDESVLGSEVGSRRSASRMSNQSFDKMSQSRYSNYSGSQMSGSRRSGTGYGSRRHQQVMKDPNGSFQASRPL